MRFNRVLLLAASINIAVLAMIFTISCSGDKGGKGDPGTSCTVEGTMLVCSDGSSTDLSGLGNDPGGAGPCEVRGGKLFCDGKEVNVGDGCEVSMYNDYDKSLAKVDCGGGNVYGLCYGAYMDFSTHYCDGNNDIVPLPSCGAGASATAYSYNKGEICKGNAVYDCSVEQYYWPKQATSKEYTDECGAAPGYFACLDDEDNAVGIFYVGDARAVSDSVSEGNSNYAGANTDIRNASTSFRVFEFQGNQICQGFGTSAAAVTACPDGYVPAGSLLKATAYNDLSTPLTSAELEDARTMALNNSDNFSKCGIRANYRACVKSSSSDTVGVFNAANSVCDKYGTANASIATCASLNNDYSQYIPIPAAGLPSTPPNFNVYATCELDGKYGECRDNNGTLKGIYAMKNEICKNRGDSDAQVQPCGAGMVPNKASAEPDIDHTQCLGGKADCDKRTIKYWDVAKQYCYYSKAYSCLEDNKDASNLFPEESCEWNGSAWTSGCKPSDAAVQEEYFANSGRTILESDRYFETAKTDPVDNTAGICYDNARARCESGYGLWIASTAGSFNKGECLRFAELSRKQCVDNRYFWGNTVDTDANTAENGKVGHCRESIALAKGICEENGRATLTSHSTKGWNSSVVATAPASGSIASQCWGFAKFTEDLCLSNGYFWDIGPAAVSQKCFISSNEARKSCAICDPPSSCVEGGDDGWQTGTQSCGKLAATPPTPSSCAAGSPHTGTCTASTCIDEIGFWTTGATPNCDKLFDCTGTTKVNQGINETTNAACVACGAGKESTAAENRCYDCAGTATAPAACGGCPTITPNWNGTACVATCAPDATLTAGANDAAACGAGGAACISLATGFWNTTTTGSEFCQTAATCTAADEGLPTHSGNATANLASACAACTAGKESAAGASFCTDCGTGACSTCTDGGSIAVGTAPGTPTNGNGDGSGGCATYPACVAGTAACPQCENDTWDAGYCE